jgi:hypothetical protein
LGLFVWGGGIEGGESIQDPGPAPHLHYYGRHAGRDVQLAHGDAGQLVGDAVHGEDPERVGLDVLDNLCGLQAFGCRLAQTKILSLLSYVYLHFRYERVLVPTITFFSSDPRTFCDWKTWPYKMIAKEIPK